MAHMGFLSLALAAALAAGCNTTGQNDLRADDSAPVSTSAENTATDADRNFVNDVAVASMAEVELGRMAIENSANPSVKAFGQQMVDDHTKAADELKTLAAEHHLTLPAQLDDDHRALRDKLAALQGASFDQQYIDAMVNGHDDVVDAFESRLDSARLADWKARVTDPNAPRADASRPADELVAEKSDNPVTMSLNQFAARMYPTVRRHLESARNIDQALSKSRVPTN